MRRLVLLLAVTALLTGCDSWFGEDAPKPLPGKRISVLGAAKVLAPDPGPFDPIALPRPEKVADWPQAGGYPGHAMYHLELAADLHRAWSASLGAGGGKREAFVTQPIVAEGKLFAMDAESQLSAFDLKSGDRLWQLDLTPADSYSGSHGGGLAYDEGRLYVTTSFGEIVAIDVAKTRIVWRKPLPAPVRGAPTVRAGRVVLITVENETIVLAADSGREVWRHTGLSETAAFLGGSSAAMDGNIVVVPYTSGELFALRVENGTVQWSDSLAGLKRLDQASTISDIRGLPVIDKGIVFAGSNSDIMAAIDLRSGRRLWDRDISVVQTPWVAGDFVYVMTGTPSLVCFEAKTGKVRWVTPLDGWEDSETRSKRITWVGPILASDRLIVASSKGQALSISPYTGALLGQDHFSDGISIEPIVADGSLIFVTDAAELVVYR